MSVCVCLSVCSDVYEEFFNPSTAAQTFLRDAAAKRVVVLHTSMSFLSQLLPQLKPQHKSGALSMLGTLADVLFKVSNDFTAYYVGTKFVWPKVHRQVAA